MVYPQRLFIAALATLVAVLPGGLTLECSTTELTVETLEECVNAVRANPEAFAYSYPCPTWGLTSVNSLERNSYLAAAAKIHADDMIKNNFFKHDGSDGRKFSDRIWAAGYPGDTVGENLAVGYRDALSVVGGWMCSETHRANLLTCAFDEVGTRVDCSTGRCYVAQEYGCSGDCCSSVGNTGSSFTISGGFFSRLAELTGRRGAQDGSGCNGLVGCFVRDILG